VARRAEAPAVLRRPSNPTANPRYDNYEAYDPAKRPRRLNPRDCLRRKLARDETCRRTSYTQSVLEVDRTTCCHFAASARRMPTPNTKIRSTPCHLQRASPDCPALPLPSKLSVYVRTSPFTSSECIAGMVEGEDGHAGTFWHSKGMAR